jgi:hypothetical protein
MPSVRKYLTIIKMQRPLKLIYLFSLFLLTLGGGYGGPNCQERDMKVPRGGEVGGAARIRYRNRKITMLSYNGFNVAIDNKKM